MKFKNSFQYFLLFLGLLQGPTAFAAPFLQNVAIFLTLITASTMGKYPSKPTWIVSDRTNLTWIESGNEFKSGSPYDYFYDGTISNQNTYAEHRLRVGRVNDDDSYCDKIKIIGANRLEDFQFKPLDCGPASKDVVTPNCDKGDWWRGPTCSPYTTTTTFRCSTFSTEQLPGPGNETTLHCIERHEDVSTGSCFPGNVIVIVNNDKDEISEEKRVSEIAEGDLVGHDIDATGTMKFVPVQLVSHSDPRKNTNYVKIRTKNGAEIVATPKHYIGTFSQNGEEIAVQFSTVQLGNLIQTSQGLSKVSQVDALNSSEARSLGYEGVYNFLVETNQVLAKTNTGNLVQTKTYEGYNTPGLQNWFLLTRANILRIFGYNPTNPNQLEESILQSQIFHSWMAFLEDLVSKYKGQKLTIQLNEMLVPSVLREVTEGTSKSHLNNLINSPKGL